MNAGDGFWLRINRVLPAPRTEIWTAMTDPAQVRRWWGPKGFSVPTLEFEPAVGKSLRITMQPPEGDVFHLDGEFREVDPPSLLAFTFRWDPPEPDDRETVVTLSVRDRGPRTEVDLEQGGFATQKRLTLHDDGWSESFEKLEELLG
ncbi:MAG TPA: SRPBCC domain-containing protein [Solirubrobacterales bacterium]|nr:SRPBCC domain-containing protein [Solirubrobacterales bacterium]